MSKIKFTHSWQLTRAQAQPQHYGPDPTNFWELIDKGPAQNCQY